MLYFYIQYIKMWLKKTLSECPAHVNNRSVDLLLSSVSLFLEPQLHIEDKSFSRMLWPNSSVSREVSDSPRDNTDINLHASSVCILHLQANVCIYRYNRCVFKCTDAHTLTFPPLTSHCCPSRVWNVSVDKTMAMMCWFLMMAAMQHFLALFYRLMM